MFRVTGRWGRASRSVISGGLPGELRGFSRFTERGGRAGAGGDGLRYEIEIAGADFALVARRGVARRFAREFGLLQLGIGGHAAILVAAGKLEHAVVEAVEA